MTIDLVTVEKSFTVYHALGKVAIERGQVLMGTDMGREFWYPLTIGGRKVECAEDYEDKRILPIIVGLTLS